ncbi:acetamidase/formamidase family protein [Alkalibacterium sp. s-m-22]
MKISKDNVVFSMDKHNPPALSVESGSTVVFETMDCFSDTVKTSADVVSEIDFSKVNPATGPLYIKGAQPGDTLKVSIHSIKISDKGAVLTSPGLGQLSKQIEKEETVICDIKEDHALYKGLRIPLNKMIGVIGTAAEGEGVNTGTPHDHGGNLDTTRMAEGATVYLPINVEGALLAMGDLHASMGDGEIMGSGLEVAGEVKVTVEVVKDFNLPLPLIETKDKWVTLGSRETMEDASKLAINNMVKVIQENSDLSFNQAGMLLSLAGHLHACQVVNPNVTMRMELAKKFLN